MPIEPTDAELLSCCFAPSFARAVAAGSPYRDAAELGDAAEKAVLALEWDEVLQALSAHPRIGERPQGEGREAAWSRDEQSGVQESTRAALAEGNRAYEERFGHVYLVCASGLRGEELLARLRTRLANDEEREHEVVRAELARIARLRAERLAG
ncbi:2-oxo-4-hydroxy-4-carboxy-5-ureidoimidazoline decarboxylase [Nonomuraea sp. NPDC050328]|uniref:2-oxo-4-hydroxy-4-carboxy-5-ureidoimidazoline decarboxylase n=1 Tax=Nonomuraea sp. NPDC050328 TaxID=3364361 RepID=UPI003799BFCA